MPCLTMFVIISGLVIICSCVLRDSDFWQKAPVSWCANHKDQGLAAYQGEAKHSGNAVSSSHTSFAALRCPSTLADHVGAVAS